MRLKQYIRENISKNIKQHWDMLNKKLSKKYNIKEKDIKLARKEVAKKHKVQEKYIEFDFIWEILENRVQLSFRIMDEKHRDYKSTVTYVWLPIEKRGE